MHPSRVIGILKKAVGVLTPVCSLTIISFTQDEKVSCTTTLDWLLEPDGCMGILTREDERKLDKQDQSVCNNQVAVRQWSLRLEFNCHVHVTTASYPSLELLSRRAAEILPDSGNMENSCDVYVHVYVTMCIWAIDFTKWIITSSHCVRGTHVCPLKLK